MAIPEFGNALLQLGRNTEQMVGPEARNDRLTVRGRFCHG